MIDLESENKRLLGALYEVHGLLEDYYNRGWPYNVLVTEARKVAEKALEYQPINQECIEGK